LPNGKQAITEMITIIKAEVKSNKGRSIMHKNSYKALVVIAYKADFTLFTFRFTIIYGLFKHQHHKFALNNQKPYDELQTLLHPDIDRGC
jgi:hypothetical protein